MIYFDRKTLAILRYINRRGDAGAPWRDIRNKFGEDVANIGLLETLSNELYTVSTGDNGKWVTFCSKGVHSSNGDFRSFCSPKGLELLEIRCFNFWKWVVPISISVAALIVSAIGALG